LQNQRYKNDAERQKNDQVSLRERASVSKVLWQRKRRCESDDATHPGPAGHKDLRRGRTRFILVQDVPAYPVRQRGAGKNPEQPQNDHQQAEQLPVKQ
jgi:hypothetical protein